MSMHSVTYLVIFLLLTIVVTGALYVLVRQAGARAVDGDHAGDPFAARPANFGAADRRTALAIERQALIDNRDDSAGPR